jgi:hypothetical protein
MLLQIDLKKYKELIISFGTLLQDKLFKLIIDNSNKLSRISLKIYLQEFRLSRKYRIPQYLKKDGLQQILLM